MSRLPIRVRLTAAFAAATAIVLALAAAFIYLRVEAELNDSIDEALSTRADLIAAQPSGSLELPGREDPEDEFYALVDADGRIVDTTSPAVTAADLEPLTGLDPDSGTDVGPLPGLDGDARVIVRAVPGGDSLIAAASTEDRDDTLAGLMTTFLIASPLALLLASGVGYLLAGGALRPVERMRREAATITLEHSGEQLALPAAHDEIYRLGETLNEMLGRIAASLERQRAFVADASHELRTPIAIVRGELELGQRPGSSPEDVREAMRAAMEEVDRLEGLTDDLLALARADDARLPLDMAEVPIPALLERVRSRFESRAAEQGRELGIGGQAPESATFDSDRIEAALGNLVENALRHGAGRVTIGSAADGASVVFEVDDEGGEIGDFAERAFERFTRAETGRTTPGSGLGLAIVKAIAEAHGGSAELVPAKSGTRAIVRIPRDPAGAS